MALRRMTACALLLLGALSMPAGPAPAQEADEAYSATVKVDATADNAAAAREIARIDGQRRALAAVIERLSGASEPAKPPKLDDKAITDMVVSFEVANEHMSAVRYVADYTFHFRQSKVRRLVRVVETPPADSGTKSSPDKSPPDKGPGDKGASDNGGKSPAEGGKPPVESGTRAIVVLPVYRDGSNVVLWDDPNEWRAAWSQRPAGSGPTHLVLPLGDAGDLAAIDAEKAGSGRSDALTAIAQRNQGSEAVVALATARRQDDKVAGLDVTMKRYRYGHLVDTQATSFEAAPGESEADLLKRAAESTAAEIETGAKRNAGAPASLAVSVPITSLGEWVQLRSRLASVSVIRKIDLLSLSRQEARIEVKYVGSQDQLKSSLAEVNLDLGGGDPIWRIQASGAASER